MIAFAKIFDFVIQFERKEYFYIKQKAKLIQQQFNYKNRKFDIELILCSFFSKLELKKINSTTYQIKIFEDLKNNLHAIYPQKDKANFAEFFNYETWVDKNLKALRISLSETL